MIIVSENTALTEKNLIDAYKTFKDDRLRLLENKAFYENRKGKIAYLKLPYAKKIVTISSSATIGNGVTLSAPDDLTPAQKEVFDRIVDLFDKQTIYSHDRAVIKEGCVYGRGYEMCYLSSDNVPIPKVAVIPSTNAFVVCDNTIERNSKWAAYFNEWKENEKDKITFYIFDDIYRYEHTVTGDISTFKPSDISFENGVPHNMGRVPITEYLNNNEQQGDFEQVISLMQDRTDLHNRNLKDTIAIAKNYLKLKGVEIEGKTAFDRNETQEQMANAQRVEVPLKDESGMDDDKSAERDISIISKNENYSSITEFGKDIDSKIYDLTMVPDLSSDAFAGNQTGVALELKLMPFKELVASKDAEIEKLYRRRLKMFVSALTYKVTTTEAGITETTSDGWFDAGLIKISVSRSWWKNAVELAQLISTLNGINATANKQLFSNQTLTELMPESDYRTEQERIANEAEARSKTPKLDPNNSSIELVLSALQKINNGGENVNES